MVKFLDARCTNSNEYLVTHANVNPIPMSYQLKREVKDFVICIPICLTIKAERVKSMYSPPLLSKSHSKDNF